ncbi:hypothetical protein DdX_07290 [Ditylenchus destructor]|uniref:Uncharacterized protein n=1 Tax=Ditylenchus destructor TaxID=166010 RepID=A0AAD4R7Y7_9BILA|nr:hypothetical protein DdX_07290 [Ditylenchus destructor]
MRLYATNVMSEVKLVGKQAAKRHIRNSNHFWVALALPCFVSTLLNVFSFLIPLPEHSIMVVIANFFLQNVIIKDAIKVLPPVIPL